MKTLFFRVASVFLIFLFPVSLFAASNTYSGSLQITNQKEGIYFLYYLNASEGKIKLKSKQDFGAYNEKQVRVFTEGTLQEFVIDDIVLHETGKSLYKRSSVLPNTGNSPVILLGFSFILALVFRFFWWRSV